MKLLKILSTFSFVLFLILSNNTHAETLKFDSATYEGEVKKGKARGTGIFTFLDGSTYEGKVKNNKIHGKGEHIHRES